jgi:hypothetical protein
VGSRIPATKLEVILSVMSFLGRDSISRAGSGGVPSISDDPMRTVTAIPAGQDDRCNLGMIDKLLFLFRLKPVKDRLPSLA